MITHSKKTLFVALATMTLLVLTANSALTAASIPAPDRQAQQAVFFAVSRQGGNSTNEIYRYTTAGPNEPVQLETTITRPTITNPYGLAFSNAGELYISNAYANPSIARLLDPVGSATTNGAIAGSGLVNPVGLVIRDGLLYVSQVTGNVEVFSLDAYGNGTLIGTISTNLSGGSPRNVAISPAGDELLVTQCCGGDAIVRYTLESPGDATFKDVINGNGLSGAHDLVFSPWGELFVANAHAGTISRFTFDSSGNAIPNGVLSGNGMSGPIGLDFSPWGELFAADHNNASISRWLFSDDALHTAVPHGFFATPNTLADLQFFTASNPITPMPTGTSTSTAVTGSCVLPPAGLLSWWPGEGNANDIIGSNDGTLAGGVTFTAGEVEQAFHFDGMDDIVLAPATGFPTGTASRTVAFWSRISPSAGHTTGFAYGTEAIGKGFYVFPSHYRSGGKLAFSGHGGEYDVLAPTDLRDGLYHHVAVTYDGALITIYADGVSVASGNLNLDTGISGGASIGGRAYMGEFLTGDVDEVAVWDRVLSASEIQAMFNAGSAGMCKDPAATPTNTSTPTETFTASPTETEENSPTPTATLVATDTNTPTPTLTATPTVPVGDWLVFTNNTYFFQFMYPPDAQIISGGTDNYSRINLPFVPGTNLSEKYLQLTVVENADPCRSPLASSSFVESSETVVINGITFLKETGEDRGAGNIYKWTAYSTEQDNACVSLDFVLHSLNPENYPTPPPLYDEAAESVVFGQIVSTYQWLDEPPISTPTPTYTPTDVPTASQTSTPTATQTPTSTSTLTSTATQTPTPTNTLRPSKTPKPTRTPKPTNTPKRRFIGAAISSQPMDWFRDDWMFETVVE